MNPKVQTPNVDQIIGTGIDTLSALRPSAVPFVVSGHYGDIFAGWRAQLKLVNRRLVDECKSARLTNAEKKALLELAASEFSAPFTLDPQVAIGETSIFRAVATTSGVIKKGTRLRIDANPAANPAVQQAQYETVEPVPVAIGQTTVSLRLRATRAGVHANVPGYVSSGQPAMPIADTLFDTGFIGTTGRAAGGSTGMSDSDIRALAKALYTGQYAPTNAAIMAGALSSIGVKHAALFQDNVLARSVLFIADESWAYSDALRASTQQVLLNAWVGFGGRVVVHAVTNQLVRVTASVQLTSAQYASDVLEIADHVRDALRAYFDSRPDFYSFDNLMMASIVSQADERILACSSITMQDLTTGATVSPTTFNGQSSGIYHYYLADNGVTLTTSVPS